MPRRANPAAVAPLLKTTAPMFAALGDHTRLQLVDRLCNQGPQSIAQLTSGGRITRQAITKHLHVLAEAGLVHGLRAGRETLWELTPNQLRDAQRFLETISRRWDDALARLQTKLERE